MSRAANRWWARELASAIDPISLDPIRTMRYPPFELRADIVQSHNDSDWFDGAVLASYLVSTGNFTHPMSRRELERDECSALDAYLKEHRLQGGGVANAHDLRDDYAKGSPPEGSQLATMRAEADQILQSFFASTAARRTASADAPRTQTAVSADGNMSIIDDDQMPSHSTTGTVPRAAAAAVHQPAAAVVVEPEPELFPGLPPAGPPQPQRALAAPGGSRYNTVRNSWGLQQADVFIGGGHGGGWSTAAAAPRRAPAPLPPTSARAAASTAASPLAGGGSGWAAAAVGRAASSGGVHSVGRGVLSTSEPSGPAKSKGQKKAAAKQRKAVAAEEVGAATDRLAPDDGAEAQPPPPPAAATSAASETGRGAGGGGAGLWAATGTAAGAGAGAGTRAGGPVVIRPSSVEEARGRHRAVVTKLKTRLEGGGMNPAEIADTLGQFKGASSHFIARAGAGDVPSAVHAAGEYLDVFLGLFGKEGSVHLLLELAALLPSTQHANAFTTALCARWGIASLPIIDATPPVAAPSDAMPAPPLRGPPAAQPAAPPPRAVFSSSAQPAQSAAAVVAAAAAGRAPSAAPPKSVFASGPTYGAPTTTLSSSSARSSGSSKSAATSSASTKRVAAAPKPAPRVTLAYAAAHQKPPGAALAPAPVPAPAPAETSARSSAAAAAAAAAAAQFDEDESYGSAAALRAAMQYGAGQTPPAGVRRVRR